MQTRNKFNNYPEVDKMATQVADASLTSKAPGKTRASAKKAPAAKKTPAAKAATATPGGTRNKLGPQGWLQDAILSVCEDFDNDKVDTEGKPLTPHRIAAIVGERTGTTPSSGAVAACLDRWDANGFAKISPKPKAFKGFTAAGKKDGLEAMVAKHRQKLAEARKKG